MVDRRLFRGVSVRTDATTDLRLDRLALALSHPGELATRGYAARVALLAGLEALEGGASPPEAGPRKPRRTKKGGRRGNAR